MRRGISLVVVEGLLEVSASLKIMNALQVPAGGIIPINTDGCHNFWRFAPKYNQAAAFIGPILGLTDLDDHPCPGGLIAAKLKRGRHPDFILRIARRELESWLLADTEALSSYLRISPALFPTDPDAEADPKRTLVSLARRSNRTSLREDLVPEQGSKGVVGKGYIPRMTEFIEKKWRPLEAQHKSESLRRALAAITRATEL
ncbi:MAG TPA: hypothetical protein VNQ79_24865 [Blastocatellia bacterium]|nr:hypothetical protein [Blastocatellia bacterium]